MADPNAPQDAPQIDDAPKSAYEKEGVEDIDPRCVPQALDGQPPTGNEIETPDYTEQDNANWRFLFNRQMKMLPGRAGEAFLDGVDMLGMTPEGIPALRDLSRRMNEATDWQIARIPGLLHERDFFDLLSRRIFPSTDYIRGEDELDYTPAPDCFHDMFGHMPMLTEPAFADFYQLFGQAALTAEGQDRVSLERLHWFTVEFGLIREGSEEIRIFGAGILSSKNEVQHALSDAVEKIPFDAERVTEQDYEVYNLQDTLFVLDSFEQLVTEFRRWAESRGLLEATTTA